MKEFVIKHLKEGSKLCKISDIAQPNNNMLCVYSDTNMLEMLMLFQAKSTRIAFVCDQKKKINPNMQSIMYSVTIVLF
jgi:hypothetical protein